MWELIQRQEAGMLALCAQICIWVSVSVEKAPNAPYFGPFSNRAKLRYVGGFSPDTLTQIEI